jgi:AcrR family transcriptional regulator
MVEQTRRRIALAFFECWRNRWFDDITLEEVAQRAQVSLRTVIRQFGGKEGLIGAVVTYVAPEVEAHRTVKPGDIDAAIERLFDSYEADGESTIRILAQEGRLPAVAPLLARARAGHRSTIDTNFAPWLDPLAPEKRQQALDALVVVMDVYAWKLLRRDMGRSEHDAKAMMLDLVRAVLAQIALTGPATTCR